MNPTCEKKKFYCRALIFIFSTLNSQFLFNFIVEKD